MRASTKFFIEIVGIVTLSALFFVALGFQSASAVTTVRVIQDTSSPAVTSASKNTITAAATQQIAADINWLVSKEKLLDPNAWSMNKKLQQQLTAEMIKWMGGQQAGQNGQVPFVQNYDEYNEMIARKVAGEFIFGDDLNKASGQCSEEDTFKVRNAVLQKYLQEYGGDSSSGQSNQCEEELQDNLHPFQRIFYEFASCKDVVCSTYKATADLQKRIVDSQLSEARAVDNARGFIPQRVCRVVNDPDGRPRQLCEIVNPPSLAADAASFMTIQMPGLSLLNVDEFDEVVSDMMSNLSNQVVQGYTGILGLSGNPNYSNNVFGPSGNLSYADALAQDDVSRFQSGGNQVNPIAAALRAERMYFEMLTKIVNDIGELDKKLEENTERFSPCFDMELTPELTMTKTDSIKNREVSSTTLAVLVEMNAQYASSTTAAERAVVLSAFDALENEGYFRTDLENTDFKLTFLDNIFFEWFDTFKYDMAVKRVNCGGDFDYDGILNSEDRIEVPMS